MSEELEKSIYTIYKESNKTDQGGISKNQVNIEINNQKNICANAEDIKALSEIHTITESQVVSRFSPKWNQFIAAMGPLLMILAGGLSTGYSATLLPELEQERSIILADQNAPSWIASMAVLPMAPGCFIGGWLMEKLGRRYTLQILSIPFFVGWVLIATAQNLSFMLVGRFLNGISIGFLIPPLSVFISECTSPDIRGVFLALISLFLAVGILISHIIGTWLSWQWTATICAFPPLLSALLLTFVPESPIWLISKSKIDCGVKSFHWLRGYSDEAKIELKGIIDGMNSIETTSLPSWKEKLMNYNSPEFLKPLFIMSIIYLTCQFSGVHAMTFYAVDIVEKTVGGGIDRHLAMLIIDGIRTITTLITCLTCKKCPRRTLGMVSGALTTISMLALSLILYFYNENIPSSLTIIPLFLLSLFIIAVNIGLIPLPFIIVGEIFPTKFRSFGAGIASVVGYISMFVVIKTAPSMMSDIGQIGTYIFYGAVSMIGTIILIFILPETKGKSLIEIEELFKSKKLSTQL